MKRIAVALALIVVLVPAGYYLWRWYDRSRDVQTTNDAYVRGEMPLAEAVVAARSKSRSESARPRPTRQAVVNPAAATISRTLRLA